MANVYVNNNVYMRMYKRYLIWVKTIRIWFDLNSVNNISLKTRIIMKMRDFYLIFCRDFFMTKLNSNINYPFNFSSELICMF